MKNLTSNKKQFACTTMIAGKNATTDGSVIVAHSDDDVSDERLIYIPAMDWDLSDPEQAKRYVYYDDCSLGHYPYPNSKEAFNSTEIRRYIGASRGSGYDTKDYPSSTPLGHIPQVAHTYAYFDSNYGVMNEHQLMIGECTCGAKFHPMPIPKKRIFYSAELSRVALERCTNAVEAIQLMGQLIEGYGYYGTGETLLVGDANEAWVMEMCGYDTDETNNGLWVAKRVPDDEYFVAANEFRIREVTEGDPDIMYSRNLFEVCQALKWWDPAEGALDWLPTVSWGEYSNPYYSLRRVWRALSKAAPSSNLPAWVEDGYTKEYPFSIKPDYKLSVAGIAAIYRDHYEGTEFDLTKGMAAGPFGNPARYEKNPDQGNTFNLNEYHPEGAWERPISIYRCGMFWINQARANMPDAVGGISWVGLDRPAANCLMPFYVGVNNLPLLMQTMNLLEFSRESAWWVFNFVANYATIKYSSMIQDIKETQSQLEEKAFNNIPAIDQKAIELHNRGDEKGCKDFLTDFCRDNVKIVIDEWWALSERLIVKYNDGCITTGPNNIMEQEGYPRTWLSEVGYFSGPISYKKVE